MNAGMTRRLAALEEEAPANASATHAQWWRDFLGTLRRVNTENRPHAMRDIGHLLAQASGRPVEQTAKLLLVAIEMPPAEFETAFPPDAP